MALSWHEDDEFWELMAPFMFSPDGWTAALRQVDQVISLLDLRPGDTILDLCCGPGRHSLELARRGFRVTGVDRTAAYLQRAYAQAEREGLAAEFVQADMRDFCRPYAFEAAMMMFTSFGYFEDPEENRRVLANVHHSLRTGGKLVLDTMGKEILARVFQERDWSEQGDALLLQERRVVNDWSWMENRWILLRGPERREFRVSHWLYSGAEMSALLVDAGFSSVELFGDFDSTRYDHTARRLVAVARK